MKFVRTTHLSIHYTEKQLMDIYLADENCFTSQMMVQELLEDQTQRFLQLIESQALGILVYPFSMLLSVKTWYKLQDPMCEELDTIPNDVTFADCTWSESGREEDCPTWYNELDKYRRDIIRDAYNYISTQYIEPVKY